MRLEEFIRKKAQSINPPKDEIDRGKRFMDSIFRVLQQKSRFRIDRCEIVGSTAKKTSIADHVDFDCVVFVNNTHLHNSMASIAEDFRNVLVKEYPDQLQNNRIDLTPRRDPKTLQFELNHVEFDISIAFNEARNHNNGSAAHKQQANYLMQKYGSGNYSSSQMYRSSAGLSKMAVDFVKEQSSFAHEIARLGKYWNKTLSLEHRIRGRSYVSGRSSIMELIAIDAAQQEEQRGSRSYLNAFRIFLNQVHNMRRIKISFSEGLRSNIHQFQAPYIVDPANPYHNYLEEIPDEILGAFSSFASNTLKILNSIEQMESYGRNANYNQIFQEQR